MYKTWVVALETYLRQVKTWSFALLVLSPFIFVLITGGVGFITAQHSSSSSSSNDNSDRIALISNQSTVRKTMIKNHSDDIDAKVTNEKTAKHQTVNQDIDGYVVLNVKNNQINATYHGDDQIDPDIKSDLMTTMGQMQHQLNLKRAHLSSNQVKTLDYAPSFKSVLKRHSKTNKNQNPDSQFAKPIAFSVLIFFTYIVLLTYSSVMAQSVAEEKGAKVIEIIFSSTTAAKYFLGKILGIMGCVITQLLIYLVGGSIIYQFVSRIGAVKQFLNSGDNQMMIHSILHLIVNPSLIFIVLGIGLYLILSALCGAMVNKSSDAAKAAQPIVYLVVIIFIAGLNFQGAPNALIPKILSYFPFSSMFFMPIRMISGHVGGLEITISLLVLVVSIIVITWLITKIYRGLMLQNDDSNFFKRLKHGIESSH